MRIPTIEENPKGLYGRYYIQKVVRHEEVSKDDSILNTKFEAEFKEVDSNAEYFVLRLDENGKDKNHINACRKAVIKYADEIEEHIPQLAKDLRNRYSKLLQ